MILNTKFAEDVESLNLGKKGGYARYALFIIKHYSHIVKAVTK